MRSVSIIGVGRVGGALALALSAVGYPVRQLFSRSGSAGLAIGKKISPAPVIRGPSELSEITEEIVFITTQDAEISNVANDLKDAVSAVPRYIFHTSGSLSSEVLKALSDTGASIGSIHPLTSISDPLIGAKRFGNAFFCIEGDETAIKMAEEIVKALGGHPFSIETDKKPLYHASAVTACGHLVALIDCATEMLSNCGLDDKFSLEVLLPLITSTVENLKVQGPGEALTGTFARADVAVLEEHIASLTGNVSPELFKIYLTLGKRSLDLAESNGIDPERIRQMRIKIAQAQDLISEQEV